MPVCGADNVAFGAFVANGHALSSTLSAKSAYATARRSENRKISFFFE